ncbi:FAD-binding oxidoreductase [Acidipila sp. EB88]|uniref:NAD(P)/FAD-dependent oxidoreductase n=1 Tax=Acidipila sp. EB88 TaxID=2305226 RepID=UPI000F5E979C|nr:FAD-dependent oxidoreductase [Acidipila sp. EB88]RRA47406.1 FAD-dependent oxidoreductase [Acidipila sp. EB88]
MKSTTEHILIAGAGIMGLAAALEFQQHGYRVTVLERGRAMEQSSWAAAGMLAVDDPENAPELLPLSRLSRSLYPAWLERVESLSGCRVPLRTTTALQGERCEGVPDVSALPPVETPSSEAPSIAASPADLPGLYRNGYRFTRVQEASLDPRDLCAALPRAVVAAGVTLREHAPIARVLGGASSDGAAAPALLLEDGETLEADHLLLCMGAWTTGTFGTSAISASPDPRLLPAAGGNRPGIHLPVAPRKGQMIEVTLEQTTMLPMVIRTPELYLVPRGDGRVVIGATVEHAGFDRSIDIAAGDRLWQQAAALWPPILKGRISARWTGLRPGFSAGILDALPVLGRLAANTWVATAHFRNGILLAPGTARVLRELVQGEATSVDLTAFSPDRFKIES